MQLTTKDKPPQAGLISFDRRNLELSALALQVAGFKIAWMAQHRENFFKQLVNDPRPVIDLIVIDDHLVNSKVSDIYIFIQHYWLEVPVAIHKNHKLDVYVDAHYHHLHEKLIICKDSDDRTDLSENSLTAPTHSDLFYIIRKNTHIANREKPVLTFREIQVSYLVAQGLLNKQIARSLKISINTVRSHISRIIIKLHCRDRSGIMRWILTGH